MSASLYITIALVGCVLRCLKFASGCVRTAFDEVAYASPPMPSRIYIKTTPKISATFKIVLRINSQFYNFNYFKIKLDKYDFVWYNYNDLKYLNKIIRNDLISSIYEIIKLRVIMGYVAKTVSKKYQRPTILRESANVCAVCGHWDSLTVHHLDDNRLNNKNTNLVCLCKSCHRKVHTGRINLDDYIHIKVGK